MVIKGKEKLWPAHNIYTREAAWTVIPEGALQRARVEPIIDHAADNVTSNVPGRCELAPDLHVGPERWGRPG
jgi:hypothetical protein